MLNHTVVWILMNDDRPLKKIKVLPNGYDPLEPHPSPDVIKESEEHCKTKVDEAYDYLPKDNQIDGYDPLEPHPSPDVIKKSEVIKQSEEHCETKVDEAYDCLPKEIETSLESDLLVKIDDTSVKQKQLLCLLDQSKYVDDDVISAYICCIKDSNLANKKNLTNNIKLSTIFVQCIFPLACNARAYIQSSLISVSYCIPPEMETTNNFKFIFFFGLNLSPDSPCGSNKDPLLSLLGRKVQ